MPLALFDSTKKPLRFFPNKPSFSLQLPLSRDAHTAFIHIYSHNSLQSTAVLQPTKHNTEGSVHVCQIPNVRENWELQNLSGR